MKSIILACAVCLQLGASYGTDDTDGVGAFAYQDSTGNRYGGTYGLRNGHVVNQQGNLPPNFSPPNFPDLDDFFPEYFNNFHNLLQEAFIPPLPFIRPPPFRRSFFKPYLKRFPFSGDFSGLGGFQGAQAFPGPEGFPGQGFPGFPDIKMPNFGRSGENSAYAGAALGPGFSFQEANINPANPNNPNIKVSNDAGSPGGFKSVSTMASSSSSDVNGQKTSSRRAETIINDNGKITKYNVES